jgi:hypothetical protein
MAGTDLPGRFHGLVDEVAVVAVSSNKAWT